MQTIVNVVAALIFLVVMIFLLCTNGFSAKVTDVNIGTTATPAVYDSTVVIDRDVSDNMTFKDAFNAAVTLSQLLTSETGELTTTSADLRYVNIVGDTMTGLLTGTALTMTGNILLNGGTFIYNEAGADLDARWEGLSNINLWFLDAGNDRIGIGTGAPSVLLDVNGALSASGNIDFDGGSFTFNESSSDHDFRVESNNNIGMWFMDAGNDRIGVGTISPTATFEVDGATSFGSGLFIFNDDGGDFDARFEGLSEQNLWYLDAGNNRIGIGTNAPIDELHLFISDTGGAPSAPSQFTIEDVSAPGITLLAGNTGISSLFFGDVDDPDVGIIFYAHDSDLLTFQVGTVEAVNLSASETVFNEASVDLDFRIESNSNANLFFIDGSDNSISMDGPVTINESGASIDFRVETNTEQWALMVDGSANQVGIMISDPQAALHVAGSFKTTGTVDLDNAVTINESSANRDMRVESNGNENMLFVDGGTNRVGVGTGTPGVTFDVVGTIRSNSLLKSLGDLEVSSTADIGGPLNYNVASGDNDARFHTTGTSDTLRINAGTDRVGINIGSPTQKLDVVEDRANAYAARFFNDGNDSSRWGLLIQTGTDAGSDGDILVDFEDGDGTNIDSIVISGGVANFASASDERMKDKVRRAALYDDGTLDSLFGEGDVQVIDFSWKERPHLGTCTNFSAQKIQAAFPGAVIEIHGELRLMLSKLIAPMFAELQNQRKEQNLQRRQIDWFRAEAEKRGWDMSTFPLE
jgi:hypothetical protein